MILLLEVARFELRVIRTNLHLPDLLNPHQEGLTIRNIAQKVLRPLDGRLRRAVIDVRRVSPHLPHNSNLPHHLNVTIIIMANRTIHNRLDLGTMLLNQIQYIKRFQELSLLLRFNVLTRVVPKADVLNLPIMFRTPTLRRLKRHIELHQRVTFEF